MTTMRAHLTQRRTAMLSAALGTVAVGLLVVGGQTVCPNGICRALTFDTIGLVVLNDWRDDRLVAAVVAFTWLGSLLVLLPLALLQAWRHRTAQPPRAAAFVPLALIGAALLAHLFKLAIARPRPDLFPALVAIPADASFPSAHAMQSAAFVLACIVRPAGRVRPAGALALGIVAALVGISRVHLQVHFPSDVLFGAAAAILWVLALRALPVWQERIR